MLGRHTKMSIIAPCDPLECIEATPWCAKQKEGPVYLRIGKAGEPNLTAGVAEPFVFGKLRYLQRGKDVCISPMASSAKAIELAKALAAKGKSVCGRFLSHRQAA